MKANGAVLTPITATLTVGYDFGNGTKGTTHINYDEKAESEGISKALDISKSSWDYYGYKATIPYLTADASSQSYVKLNNNSTKNAYVYWDLTDDKGNRTKRLRIEHGKFENESSADKKGTLANGESALWTASSLRAAALAVKPEFGIRFRVERVLVTANPGLVNGTANISTAQGNMDVPLLKLDASNLNYSSH